jgi:hypothetical protein
MANPNRTADGKFARCEHQAKLRDAFAEAVTPEDIKRLASVLMRFAEAGDMVAIKLLLERSCGRSEGPARTPSVAVQINTGNNRLIEMVEQIRVRRLGSPTEEN